MNVQSGRTGIIANQQNVNSGISGVNGVNGVNSVNGFGTIGVYKTKTDYVGGLKGSTYFILSIILMFIFIIYIIVTSYNSGSGSGVMGWTLLLIFAFCIYILCGLHIAEGVNGGIKYMLTWGMYSALCFTFINILFILYIWSVIRVKTGPPGIRGIIGDRGNQGTSGKCSIDANQFLAIQSISKTIDKLYGSKPENNGESIYDPILNTFSNIYLTNKIKRMCTSNQFAVVIEVFVNEHRSINNFFDYLTQIWTEWFELLWQYGGIEWFKDPYGDENFEWIDGVNPFDEIRKYDIYYWDITEVFRPLKAEICRSNSEYQNPVLPYKDEPRLKVIYSNDYQFICNDNHTKGSPDIVVWRAKSVTIGDETYYPVGDVITFSHATNIKKGPTIVNGLESYSTSDNGPDKLTLLVTGDIKPPVSYYNIWSDLFQKYGPGYGPAAPNYKYRNGGQYKCTMYKPIPPKGYVCLGDVFGSLWQKLPGDGATSKIMCVPIDSVELITDVDEKTIWHILHTKFVYEW